MAAFEGGGGREGATPSLPPDRRLPSATIVRRFRQPVPVRVEMCQGRPVRVTTDRRHLYGGAVEICAGPWRSSGDWWERAPPFYWDREEWDVSLRGGTRYIVSHDRQRGSWFLDGILD